jgi:hypothetical protein
MQRANDADSELGGRLVVRGTATFGGETVHIRGYGEIEADLKRDRFVMIAGGRREETFDDEPFTFIPVTEELASHLPPSVPAATRWLKVDQDVVAEAAGTKGLRELQSLSPAETVELMTRLDPSVRPAGRERVRGVPTKRYRIAVSFPKLVKLISERAGRSLGCAVSELKGSMRIVLWIDDTYLIRRMRLRMGSGDESIVITSTITAYDRDLRVDVPGAAEVYDATDEIAKAAERARRRAGESDCDTSSPDTV